MNAMASQSTGEDQSIGSQSVAVAASGAMISFGFIPISVNGRMQIKVDNVTTDVGILSVDAKQGFLSKINNKLTSNPAFKEQINNQFTMMIKTQLPITMNDYLMLYPIQRNIPTTVLDVDVSLVQDPVVSAQGYSELINGTIYPTVGSGVFVAYAPTAMPFIDTTAQQEFQMFINDWVFTSAIQNSFNAGLLNATFPDDFQKLNIAIKSYTTDDFVQWFPDIVTMYGAGTKVKKNCFDIGGNAPTVKSTDSQMEIKGTVTCIFSAWDNVKSDWINFLNYAGDYTFLGKLSMDNNMLNFDATNASVANVVLNSSTMNGVTAETLMGAINSQMMTVIPFRKSFELPISDFVTLSNPVIAYKSGYVEILAGAQFQALKC
jgi:hypothetical protein